jgi:hypothetical protein
MAHKQASSRLKPVPFAAQMHPRGVAGLAKVMDRGTMSALSTEIF